MHNVSRRDAFSLDRNGRRQSLARLHIGAQQRQMVNAIQQRNNGS